MAIVWSVLIGIAAGILSGLFGIGGGILMVPAMALLLGFEQKKAQGTSLATLVIPVAFPAVLNYHRDGFVDWGTVAALAGGFLIGGWGGSFIAVGMDPVLMKRGFAVFLVGIAFYMWFKA